MEDSGSAPNGTNARLPPAPPAPPARTPRRETHRVLYDFVGQNENEVTMKRGEHVLVTQGDTNGWSLVKMEAGVGWAPSEYLTELELEPPPAPRFPVPPSTTSSEPPPPPALLRCDACKKDAAECKRTSDVCDRCKEQGLLCTSETTVKPPPPTCQGYGRSARIVFANEDHDKPQSCIACRVEGMAPGEDFCSRCKSNGIKPIQRLPTSCYTPEKEPPLGFRKYRAMKASTALRACHTCYFAKMKCDEGKPVCSNCLERKVRCKYSRLLDLARPIPGASGEGEDSKAACASDESNALFPAPLQSEFDCVECKLQSKHCDRRRTYCTQCARTNVLCAYQEAIETPKPQEPPPQFNELHLVCGPCRKAGAHCIGFPSHTCTRCNDNNIECQITLRPAIIEQFKDSDSPKNARLACDGCRRFLTYCDKAMPTCSSCEARDYKCNYRDDSRRERNVASSGFDRKIPDSRPLDNRRADEEIPESKPHDCRPADGKTEEQVCEDCKANGDEHDTEWPSCTSCAKLRSESRNDGQILAPLANNHSGPRKLIRKNIRCCLPGPFVKSPTKLEPLPEKIADSTHSKSADKPDPQEPREQDRDRDEWEWIDKTELEEEIDIVVVEPEPQSTKCHVGKQKSELGSEDGEMEKEIDSNLDALVHAAGQLNLLAWSGKDSKSTCEGYIVDRVVLKNDKVSDEIVMNRARLDRIH